MSYNSPNSGADIDAAVSKIAGVEAGAQVNRTPAQLKTDYESNANTNAFTDAEKTKLGGVIILAEELNYADLVANRDPVALSGISILVTETQGSILSGNLQPNGIYRSNGTTWIYMGYRNGERMHGFIDVGNTLGSQAFTAGVPIYLANNGLSPNSRSDKLPDGVTAAIWDTTNNEFDFSELSDGDLGRLRISGSVTTTAVNQRVDILVEFAIGGNTFELLWGSAIIKTAGTYPLANPYKGFYIGGDNVRLNPTKIKLLSDAAGSFAFDGFFLDLTRLEP